MDYEQVVGCTWLPELAWYPCWAHAEQCQETTVVHAQPQATVLVQLEQADYNAEMDWVLVCECA